MTAGVIEITMAGIGPPGEAMGVIGGDLQGALPNPTIKPGVIDTSKLANLAVTDAKIASVTMAKVTGLVDALLAKQDAIATGTYVANNDARLSDERTPTNGSVSSAKIADGAVTDVKIAAVGVGKVTGLTALLVGYTTDAELVAETSRAVAAENVLSGRITDETAARIANDNTLNGYVVAETARAQGAENTIAAAVETERLARINDVDLVESDLAAEESRALTAESNLQTAIGTETTRATNAELVLTGNLTTEINTRGTEDVAVRNFSTNRANHSGTQPMSSVTGLEEAIAAQVTQTEMDEEVARATAAEATKLTKSSNLSDLTNVVTARTNLGLGTAAQTATTDYDAAGSAVSARTFAIQRANHTGTQAQSTIDNLTTDLAAKASQAALAAEVDARTAALASKADLVGGKVPLSQLDSVVISDFLGEVATESAMLALVGMRGDWAIRTDLAAAFILIGDNSTQLANWKRLPTPADLVSSVNGRTGVVTGLAEQTALQAEINRAVAGEAAAVASAVQRANHTGTQAISTVTGLQDALNARATANDLTLEIARAVAAEDALETDVQGLETDVASLDASLVSEIAARIADVDSAQAYSIQRSNHTGVQVIATVSGLQAALDSKASDVGVLHLAGSETVTGVKIFSNQVILGYVGTPADGTIAASQYTLWWDNAPNSGGLRIKGKDSTGAVMNRTTMWVDAITGEPMAHALILDQSASAALAPELYFRAFNGRSSDKLAWLIGIDIAGSPAARDLVIAEAIFDGATDAVRDFLYFKKRSNDGSLSPVIGIGNASWDANYVLSIEPPPTEGALGGLKIGMYAATTGDPFAIIDDGLTKRFALVGTNGSYYLTGSHAYVGAAIVIQAEPLANRSLVLCNNAKSLFFGWEVSGSSARFRQVGAGVTVFESWHDAMQVKVPFSTTSTASFAGLVTASSGLVVTSSFIIKDGSALNRVWVEGDPTSLYLRGDHNLTGAAIVIQANSGVTQRPLVLSNNDKDVFYGWQFNSTSIDFRNIGGGVTAIQVDTNGKVSIPTEDLEVVSITKGIILKSPNGTRYKVTVEDDGALFTAAA